MQQREPIIVYGIAVAAKCRSVRVGNVLSPAQGERKSEKVTVGWMEGGLNGQKRKRDVSGRSEALGFLHGEARGNLRCAANVSLPGSAHRQLPNFE